MANAQSTIEDYYFNPNDPLPRYEGEPCPDADALWMAAAGEGDLAQRLAVFEHCAKCPACAQDLRVTRELVSASQSFEQDLQSFEPVARPRLTLIETQPTQAMPLAELEPDAGDNAANHAPDPQVVSILQKKPWRSMLKVAGVCSVAAGVMFYVGSLRKSSSVKRGAAAEQTFRKGAKATPPPKVDALKFGADTFSWTAKGVGRFEVEIFSASFNAWCTLDAGSETSMKLSLEQCPKFQRGQDFYWKLRSIGQDGRSEESAATLVHAKGR